MIVITNSDIFGRNLKYLRQQHNLSQGQMAELLQMVPGKLEALESGKDYEIDAASLLILYKSFVFEQEKLFYELLSP